MNEIAWRFAPSLIDEALRRALPELAPSGRGDERAALHQAMHYAVFSGGKRLRSQLALEAAGVAGGDAVLEKALPAACAIEMIHAYSLVHDDLPAMDNADTRRGRPSCHKQFGEAVAILAGDALLTLAFETLANGLDACPKEAQEEHGTLQVLWLMARAAGAAGMVGGQAIDIAWSNRGATDVSGDALTRMHAMKTGALIRAASEAGAVLGGGTRRQVEALRDYGAHLGRAFQLTDDLLDATGDPLRTGKAATDSTNGKATAPQVFGLRRSRELACEASEAAVGALRDFGLEADALRQLARSVVHREK